MKWFYLFIAIVFKYGGDFTINYDGGPLEPTVIPIPQCEPLFYFLLASFGYLVLPAGLRDRLNTIVDKASGGVFTAMQNRIDKFKEKRQERRDNPYVR